MFFFANALTKCFHCHIFPFPQRAATNIMYTYSKNIKRQTEPENKILIKWQSRAKNIVIIMLFCNQELGVFVYLCSRPFKKHALKNVKTQNYVERYNKATCYEVTNDNGIFDNDIHLKRLMFCELAGAVNF